MPTRTSSLSHLVPNFLVNSYKYQLYHFLSQLVPTLSTVRSTRTSYQLAPNCSVNSYQFFSQLNFNKILLLGGDDMIIFTNEHNEHVISGTSRQNGTVGKYGQRSSGWTGFNQKNIWTGKTDNIVNRSALAFGSSNIFIGELDQLKWPVSIYIT